MDNVSIYIKEWSDIQNIVVEKEYNKFILDEINVNEEDVCERLTLDKCKLVPSCIECKSRCVRVKRMKRMHNKDVMITSKKYHIKFRVLASIFMSKVQLTTASIDMYYCIVESTISGVVYVLFSSGIVLTRSELYNNRELNDRIKLLALKVIELAKRGKKIVLGGHSMGCVLGMYAGWNIFNLDKQIFQDSVFVLGTAGAKWMNPDMYEYGEAQNVIQFVSGELRKTKTKQNMLVDCFQIDGDDDFTSYPRTKLVYYDTEDGSPHLYETSDVKALETLGITLTHTVKNTSQCKKLHMWKYYMGLLQEIYGDVNVLS